MLRDIVKEGKMKTLPILIVGAGDYHIYIGEDIIEVRRKLWMELGHYVLDKENDPLTEGMVSSKTSLLTGRTTFVVFLKPHVGVDTISHEAFHMTMRVMKVLNLPWRVKRHELYAGLQGRITRQLEGLVRQHREENAEKALTIPDFR